MSTLVDCRRCQRQLRIPDDLLGKLVRCPNCGETFTAGTSSPPKTTDAPAPPSEPTVQFSPEQNDSCAPVPAAPLREEVTAQPPARARPLPKEREKWDDDDDRPWERGVRRDSDPHRGATVLTLGIISIACSALALVVCNFLSIIGFGMGLTAWVMGQKDLAKMKRGEMDARGQGQTQGGWICGIIGTILGTLGLLLFVVIIVYFGFVMFGAWSVKKTPAPTPAPGQPKMMLEVSLPRYVGL